MFKLPPTSQVFLFILLVISMGILGQVIFSLSLMVVPQESLLTVDWSDPRVYISSTFFSQVFMFLMPFLLFMHLTGERFSDLILLKKIRFQYILLTIAAFILCILLFPLLDRLNEPLREILPTAMVEREAATDVVQNELLFSGDAVRFVFMIISLAILPAIFEELVFRGFLINKMISSGLSENGAILMSAAIFAISHFQPLKFLAMFVIGIALGFVYRRFGNLKYSMLFHFLVNGSQITYAYLLSSGAITGF